MQDAAQPATVLADRRQQLLEGAAAVQDHRQVELGGQGELGFQQRQLPVEAAGGDVRVEADLADGDGSVGLDRRGEGSDVSS